MATLGSLVVSLEANIASFATDLGKAVTVAEASMAKISHAIGQVQSAFAMLGGGLGVAAIATFELRTVSAAAHLQELRTETGLSVTALSAMGNIAAQTGGSVDDAAKSFDRMQKNASSAASGNRAMTAAFASVGISSAQLSAGLKDPETLMLSIAQAMEKYADDGNKTVAMMTLFGRAGAGQIELLHQLAAAGYSNATVTAEQALKAKEFEVELANMSSWIKQVGLDLAMGLIPAIKLGGAALITGFSDAWASVRYDAGIAMEWIESKVQSTFASLIPKVITDRFPSLNIFSQLAKDADAAVDRFAAARDAIHKQNAAIMAEAATDYVNQTQGPGVQASGAKKPSIVAPVHDDVLKGQKNLLSATLAMMNESMRAQEAVVKTTNAQLDADYKNGLMSLSAYSTSKYEVLDKSARDTAKIYNDELRVAVQYMNSLPAGVAKDAEAQRIQQLSLEQGAKLEALNLQRIATNQKVMADQETLAKTTIDVGIAYANMNGDTATANALSTAKQYNQTREILLANNMTEAVKQLDAVQKDSAMRASQSPLAGMTRAVIDYQKGLADVAKQTEAMTSKMLTGMEDALVNFVHTGKINFKSLIDSMIADLIRMQIRQQAMPWIAKLFGMAAGALGAAYGGAGVDTNAQGSAGFVGPPQAAGGPVQAGVGYPIGERGPETFVPGVQGTIIPNGGGGGLSVVYSPNINIDSRADRGQIQKDTAAMVRQGQADLMLLLKRYNPGLRM